MSSETCAPKKLLKPIIISNKKKMIIKSPQLLANIKFPVRPVQQYKEEVIYSSSNCDFLKGESQEVLIVNRLNLITKTCRTVAKCTGRGKTIESSSDSVSSVIGQKNYETVLSALSSVFSEETKVRGILALLSTQKGFKTAATQTEMDTRDVKSDHVDTACQTVDTSVNMFVKERQRKRIRRHPLAPYVVTDRQAVKKFVINIKDVKKDMHNLKKEELKEKTHSLPDLKLVVDEDSNMSCGSNLSLSSLPSVTGVLDNPQEILKSIDKVTDKTLKPTGIPLRDGSIIMVPIKPEDDFHIATPEILKNVTREERMKLIWHQAFIDFKLCLEQDEDGYYPLHIAVLSSDADLVRRQCAALRARHESVDLPGGGGLTALHMSVRQNASTACTNILLQNGGDPLLCDQDRRCSLHLAAEIESPQLRCLINYCDTHARSVLKNNLDYWRPEYESRTDDQLKNYLYECVSEMFDDQGYSPLMLAAEAAIPANVSLLAARAPALVDAPAPSCGATALYRAVAKACLYSKETGNKITTTDKILKTIEILVEHGADPSIENHSGSSVNTLLTEFNISTLSMTIANKMTALKHGKLGMDYPNTILYKHNDGRIAYKDINNVTDKTEMTEVRNIPPGLHAIITIDVPSKRKKSEDTKNVKGNDSKTGKDAKSSKRVTNKMKNFLTINDLVFDNAILKNAMKERTLSFEGMNKLSLHVKANNSSDMNTNQVKIGLNMGVNDGLINDNTDILKQIKTDVAENETVTQIANNVNVVNVKSDKILSPDKNISSKDELKTSANELISPNKRTEVTDSNETLTRSAKEKKTEKVVIVENVALKRVFPIPNILKASRKGSVKASDLLLSPKLPNKSNNIIKIAPRMITSKNDIANVQKYRKRKLE